MRSVRDVPCRPAENRWICFFKIVLTAALGSLFFSVRLYAGDLYHNPYVTFSPDRTAFTTNAGDQNCRWYGYGTVVKPGNGPACESLQTGQHYFTTQRVKNIPVGYWRTEFTEGHCYHDYYPPEGAYYHGISFGRRKCLREYYSGWIAYCADCGEKIVNMFVYMSEDAARSISRLDMGYTYYYLCPFCNNLEMGADMGYHLCRKISWNRYQIRYDSNADGWVEGYMPNSTHMYNNAEIYEGSSVSVQKTLSPNGYKRAGYCFQGWNTRADGSGQGFADQQEIWNLSQENYDSGGKGVVVLYAQWEHNTSLLQIDPAEGSYRGKTGITEISGSYGETYAVDMASLVPPCGKTVFFDSRGGSYAPSVTGAVRFAEWILELPFLGAFHDMVYFFLGEAGEKDQIRASYRMEPVSLPVVYKEDCTLKGWYYDPEYTRFAGMPGDLLLPLQDMTLYARWEDDLKLTAWVERILDPHDPIFRSGESGTLFLEVSGFPDRVEVRFPRIVSEQFPEVNVDYSYEGSQFASEERIDFMVPLYTPAGEYSVVVTARRGDEILVREPLFWTLGEEESVLNEIRTRLRE